MKGMLVPSYDWWPFGVVLSSAACSLHRYEARISLLLLSLVASEQPTGPRRSLLRSLWVESIAGKHLPGPFCVLAHQTQAQGRLQLILGFLLLPSSHKDHAEVVAELGRVGVFLNALLE